MTVLCYLGLKEFIALFAFRVCGRNDRLTDIQSHPGQLIRRFFKSLAL